MGLKQPLRQELLLISTETKSSGGGDKDGVWAVCVCVPLKTGAVHLPRPSWAGQASFNHIPQIIQGQAEASLNPPGQTLVNSSHAQRATRLGKLVSGESIFWESVSPPPLTARIHLCLGSHPEWPVAGKQALQVFAEGTSPPHPLSPLLSLLCLPGAGAWRQRGSGWGEGRARAIDTRAIVSQRPPPTSPIQGHLACDTSKGTVHY